MVSALFSRTRLRAQRAVMVWVTVIVVLLSAGATSAFATAEHPLLGSFGRSGSEGLPDPNGIASDESSGDVYVAGMGQDEQQTVSIEGGPTGGSVTLEVEGEKTTALPITPGSNPGEAFPPTAGEIEGALNALSKIGAGNIAVSQEGSLPATVTYTITFQAALATRQVPPLACDGSTLTGGSSPACTVATLAAGIPGAVYKFDAQGKPTSFTALPSNELTGASTPAHSFAFPITEKDTPAAIAVDNSTNILDPSRGDLYVMDAGHGVIDKFNAAGEYLSQIIGFDPPGAGEHELLGIAVDANGTLRADLSIARAIGNRSAVTIDEFDNSITNNLTAEQVNPTANASEDGIPEGVQNAQGFAVGPTGDDYLLYGETGRSVCTCVTKFGQQLAGLGQIDHAESGDVAVAADPATGHVYIDDQSSVGEWDTGAMSGGHEVSVGNGKQARGVLVSSFGSEPGQLTGSSTEQGGIAVDGQTGKIYVSNPANGKVYVFGSDAPAVTTGAAMNVTKERATLHGTIDPRGSAITECHFEYGVADEFGMTAGERYEKTAACDPAQVGNGSVPVPVSASMEGLQSGLLYRFRLVAVGANGTNQSAGLLATPGVGFGVKKFEVSFLNEDGTPDTQAGSHPFALVTNIEFNSHYVRKESNADSPYALEPDGTLKDLKVDLPPGLGGDPNATKQKCTLRELDEINDGDAVACPAEAELGHLQLVWSRHVAASGYEPNEKVYNMVTPHGTAAQFGINYVATNLFLNSGLLAGGDYPIQTTIENAPPGAPVTTSRLTIYGVVNYCVNVGENRGKYHDSSCHEAVEGTNGAYEKLAGGKPFLTLPTGCDGPLRSSISIDSYQDPGHWVGTSEVTRTATGAPVSLTGCSKLQFPPEIGVAPDTTDASTSSGLTVHVKVPQTAAFNPTGLAESALRDTTVALPPGVAINPSGGDGLEACSEGLAGFTGLTELNPTYEPKVNWATFTPTALQGLQPGVSFCPNGAKIATVKVKTPLLEHELEGAMYLASQNANPFGSLMAIYMMIEDPLSGSTIKVAGEVQLCRSVGQVVGGLVCEAQGQIVATFKNFPDEPFEDAELHFFGGERAPLATPSRCGTYTTKAVFTPWDGNGPVTATSSFTIDHGPGGGLCPGASLPFNPAFTGGSTNIQAGAFTPLTGTFSRQDGEQQISRLHFTLPPGLSGVLTGVKLCGEVDANAGSCGPESLIGETTVAAGVGSDPITVTGGKVYLTGPYHGAPFGISVVDPVKAGPFDLEHDTSNPSQDPACDCVVVRAKLEIDPLTTAVTVTSNSEAEGFAIPHLIDGIPVELKKINFTTTRTGFQFNPTNCEKMSIAGSAESDQGESRPVSVPFQVTNCATLGFKPGFKASTSGRTSRARGASLHVLLTYPKAPFGSQANIRYVKVDLPKQLPSRLSTLQKACTEQQFAANPAACPGASRVGFAKAITPILPVPLEGPAYFVSHGGAKFPELIVVLQGYGVTIDLHGETFIDKAGITSSTYRTVPDAPVGSFELTLPEGRFSALAANTNLCSATLKMPTMFIAQNGAVIKQSTPIAVTGCKPALRVVRRKVKGSRVTLTINTPMAGRLIVKGAGLSSVRRSVRKAGNVTVTLTLTKAEQTLLRRHRGRRLRTKIRLSLTPQHGHKLTSSVTVLVG